MTEFNKYHNTKIYKIIADDTDLYYIGSTYSLLCARMAKHRDDYKKGHKKISSCEVLKFKNPRIVLIENYKCENKEEMRMREEYYLQLYKDQKVNKNRAYVSEEKKIEERSEYNKEYRENNRDKLLEYNKEYLKQKITCDCGINSTIRHIAQHKKSKRHNKIIENKNIENENII